MTVLLIIIGCIFLGFVVSLSAFNKVTEVYHQKIKDDQETELEAHIYEEASNTSGFLNAGLGLAFIALLFMVYQMLKGSPYEGHLFEWLNIIVRWAHITFGIAWIGASFYFVFLENSLNRKKDLRDELAGNLWAVHGGGFYYLEKYKLAPKTIPKELHWFKYEAYFTWLSGFCLLWVVYYFNAKGNLIDPNVADLTPATAVTIGILGMLAGWLCYDLLCKSPIVDNGPLFFVVFFLVLTGFSWYFAQVFSARAAYIHVGAVIGTLMVGNVFFGIIPAQKEMVKAATEGRPLDPSLGKNAGRRSMHNNYFTLPIIFIMISNHFPSTFGHEYNWAVLALISLGSAAFKHYLNLSERGEYAAWVIPATVVLVLAATYTTAPVVLNQKCEDKVTFTEIYSIIDTRCKSCHSAVPTDDFYTAPPNGIVYDTPGDITKLTDKIMQRVVITKTMPQNNKTGMLEEERIRIKCWIEQGATTSDE